MDFLLDGIKALFSSADGWKMILMWVIGGLLIWLAIKKILTCAAAANGFWRHSGQHPDFPVYWIR